MIETLFEIICKIPDAVWAAIIASLLTLGGVLLTNRENNKRLIAQLEHDADIRKTQRLMELRTNVYLPAVEAVSNTYLTLAKMADLDLSEKDISEVFSKSSASISKINIVGTIETVKALSALSSILSETYLQLVAKRTPLIERKNDIENTYKLYNDSSKEKDRLLELIKEFNLQGSTDKRRWEAINNRYDFENQQTDEYNKELDELEDKNSKELKEYAMKCYVSLKEVGQPITVAISAIRKEMEIPFDSDEYQEIIDNAFNSGQESLDRFFKEISQENG
ncbi:MAG TPA: hypothetical protein ENI82_06745 [Bacteroidetes bacterium]|nr:hypothetical protein [Bacteroidota bacterium]